MQYERLGLLVDPDVCHVPFCWDYVEIFGEWMDATIVDKPGLLSNCNKAADAFVDMVCTNDAECFSTEEPKRVLYNEHKGPAPACDAYLCLYDGSLRDLEDAGDDPDNTHEKFMNLLRGAVASGAPVCVVRPDLSLEELDDLRNVPSGRLVFVEWQKTETDSDSDSEYEIPEVPELLKNFLLSTSPHAPPRKKQKI